MERKCKNCKENCKENGKEKVELTEMHLGMQKMIIEAVTAYLFSEEARKLGITEVHIVKKETDDSISIESSFVKGIDKDVEIELTTDEEDEDYEDEEDGEDNEPDTEILKDIFDFLSNLSELAERKDENVKPKSKRGRKKKTE